MTRIVHLNGKLLPEPEAKISVFDRAVTFADSVYEGFGIPDGDIVDFIGHHTRLLRSLGEIGIAWDKSCDETYRTLRALIDANKVAEGFLYLQITRDAEDRDYVPGPGLVPTVIAYTQPVHPSRADQLPAASLNVCPVVGIDEHTIGTGQAGPITKALHGAYVANARASFYVPKGPNHA